MTTLELIAFLEYLKKHYFLTPILTPRDLEIIAFDYQKNHNKPEWTDNFSPPSPPEK